MWDGLEEFAQTAANSYKLDVWASQSPYLEVWLEKDALSGIFEDVLYRYGVTLNVGRGFDGWSSIHNAAGRYAGHKDDNKPVVVLYFGDFDPSGEDMVRSLRDRLAYFACFPQIVKCALTREDIDRYSLPPNFTKPTDTRAAKFIQAHGDISVELDALPADVLISRLVEEVEMRLDLGALEKVWNKETADREMLVSAFSGIGG
jgi:hypothetical protein